MKREVKVVGVQCDIKSAVDDGVAGRDWNVDYMVGKIEEYGSENDLIVFPELANSGYIRALEHGSNFRRDLYKNSAEDFPDGYTAKRILEACKKIGCYAVINEYYQKPTKKLLQNDSAKILNLNRLDQIIDSETAQSKYLQPIKNITDEITNKRGKALVVWIHGLADDSLKEYEEEFDISRKTNIFHLLVI